MEGKRMVRLVLSWLLLALSEGIPIDNQVEGEPEIECGPTSVMVNFNVQNPFEGAVYVQGNALDETCRNEDRGRRTAGIEIPFGTCDMVRRRSIEPRGVFVTTTIVVTFHPQFLTKVDRGFRIQCFYMEADKTADIDLDVSALTTLIQDLTGGVQQVPMPICRYEILDGNPDADPVEFVEIGRQIYHKWTCDTDTIDTFCMTVHSCVVDDTSGEQALLIDEDGCSPDPFLLQNLEYLTDLMAGREAHAFKYADRSQMYFQCQIRLEVKEPGEECVRAECAEPARRNFLRTKRGTGRLELPLDRDSMDVQSQIIKPLDIDDKISSLEKIRKEKVEDLRDSQMCLSSSLGLSLLFSTALLLLLFLIGGLYVSYIFCLRDRTKNINFREQIHGTLG